MGQSSNLDSQINEHTDSLIDAEQFEIKHTLSNGDEIEVWGESWFDGERIVECKEFRIPSDFNPSWHKYKLLLRWHNVLGFDNPHEEIHEKVLLEFND